MAIIGKIRSKSGLLVGIIGLALLSFILGDYQSFFGSSEGEYGIGTVYGEKIDPNKYNETNQQDPTANVAVSRIHGRLRTRPSNTP